MIRGRKSNRSVYVAAIALAAILCLIAVAMRGKKGNTAMVNIIRPEIGDVGVTVTTTGVVEPQNRLQIKPSIGGRIDDILVKEGDAVKTGDILAWMSSTERAALVDAARSQGPEVLKYWEEVYKKSPVISPIDGEVIVREVEPGQTVTTSEPILVISDRLVVKAQFDETDVGRVKIGQRAGITLDAYPEIKIDGIVVHIAYESKIVNNVTIYDVDILPKDVPAIMRSGMSVTADVVESERKGVLTVPSNAVKTDGERRYVIVQDGSGRTAERDISAGLADDSLTEVISGLSTEDCIQVIEVAYAPQKKKTGKNPFMPDRRNR